MVMFWAWLGRCPPRSKGICRQSVPVSSGRMEKGSVLDESNKSDTHKNFLPAPLFRSFLSCLYFFLSLQKPLYWCIESNNLRREFVASKFDAFPLLGDPCQFQRMVSILTSDTQSQLHETEEAGHCAMCSRCRQTSVHRRHLKMCVYIFCRRFWFGEVVQPTLILIIRRT